MCSGSKRKPTETGGFIMEEDHLCCNFSVLLELTASDDLDGFKKAIEEEGYDIDEPGLWYCRKIGSRKMGLEERTPLMVAAMYGSKNVLNYIIATRRVDVNRSCGSDKATPLHCTVSGGSHNAPEIVRLLVASNADVNLMDCVGNRPIDLIPKVVSTASSLGLLYSRRRVLEAILKGNNDDLEEEIDDQDTSTPRVSEKKEYPIDLTLPDIKNGIYGTDEFRMYTFKIKPCSRAYSHDWTECPFVHPGENARRRDPRKYHYSCVPCPEFRKGSCRQGDACEYAHGIFECWLHPAQYRTRLCKDETNCNRRVCFFAHKPEELRPLYASTGSAVPSPRAFSSNGGSSIDMISPLNLGSPTVMMVPPVSTPPSSPSAVMWQNNVVPPPTLQLLGSRLKSSFNARDIDYDMELRGLLSPSTWLNNNSLVGSAPFSPSADRTGELNRLGGLNPANLDDVFGSVDSSISPRLQRVSFGGANASTFLSQRSAAFAAKRSQSFIDRTAANSGHSNRLSSPVMSPNFADWGSPDGKLDWGSPDGKLDWGIQGDELNKLRKSASFGFRRSSSNNNNTTSNTGNSMRPMSDEPDVSWVHSLVKDNPDMKTGSIGHLNPPGSDMLPAWVEQLYMEQEQMVA